ncbi:MAG: ATPase domain-containing protein [Candidatus Methanoperedens sp.]|nr:ATPase domain-containing protein [Candidatus Methanoperedens sp.]
MIPITLNRTPTGISTLDTIIKGGFPSGSLVLLIGDVGAGSTEFAYTCAVMHSMMKKNPEDLKLVSNQLTMLLQKEESLKFPEKICYISFTHTKEDIMAELGHTFPPEFASTLSENMIFRDLSPNSLFPSSNKEDWISLKALRSEDEERQIINELVSTLDTNAPDNLVIIDSLTSLFHACNRSMSWNDSISFLEELQRKSKKWDGLVFLLLGRGIFESMKEEEMMDIADGALVFEWFEEGFSRQQAMYMKKFRGVMPHIARDFIIRFNTMVTNTDGFVVTNVKRIFGRK